jgi:hypothetical protein
MMLEEMESGESASMAYVVASDVLANPPNRKRVKYQPNAINCDFLHSVGVAPNNQHEILSACSTG